MAPTFNCNYNIGTVEIYDELHIYTMEAIKANLSRSLFLVTYVLLGSGTVVILVLDRIEKVHVEDLQRNTRTQA